MGIIKEQYEEYGKEFLPNFLIGAITSVVECDFRSDSEKVKEIEKLIKEYYELKNNK